MENHGREAHVHWREVQEHGWLAHSNSSSFRPARTPVSGDLTRWQ